MITLIASTNRENSEAHRFSIEYLNLFRDLNASVKFLSLAEMNWDFIQPDMYSKKSVPESIRKIQLESIIPAKKFFFVLPEYNGSIPGILKLFIDAVSVMDIKPSFKGKKAGLVGVASGRAGNLRGMDHMSDILNYLGVIVMPNRLPISSISRLVNENGQIHDEHTLSVMRKQAEEFVNF